MSATGTVYKNRIKPFFLNINRFSWKVWLLSVERSQLRFRYREKQNTYMNMELGNRTDDRHWHLLLLAVMLPGICVWPVTSACLKTWHLLTSGTVSTQHYSGSDHQSFCLLVSITPITIRMRLTVRNETMLAKPWPRCDASQGLFTGVGTACV